jgi:nicotinamidase/pyrazinamidase
MRALIIVDVQNDFVPGGALPTRNGHEVVPIINLIQSGFDLVVATQDWHPRAHGSFASNHRGRTPGEVIDLHGIDQVLWPDHCVQNSRGAELHPALDTERIDAIIRKGTDPEIDSYSGFYDNGRRKATGLAGYLREKGTTAVYVTGLATDYCVKYTALDAQRLGFRTFLVEDACRGVDLAAGDIEAAVEEMRSAGVTAVRSEDLSQQPHPR